MDQHYVMDYSDHQGSNAAAVAAAAAVTAAAASSSAYIYRSASSSSSTSSSSSSEEDLAGTDNLCYLPPSKAENVVNDHDQYPTRKEFDSIVQDYLQNLSTKKRDKALVDRERYELILQVLKDPRNTAISTAQFRFWVKKMFQLMPLDNMDIVCHDNKPVAMREHIYGILVRAHREAHHGGRDKTSALVSRLQT